MMRIVNMMMLLWTQTQSENDEDITAGRCKGTGAGTMKDMNRIVTIMMVLWMQSPSKHDGDSTAGRCEGTGAGTNEDNRHMAKDRRQLLREWMKHGGEGPRYADD